jgi:hypothetical protein
MSLKRLLFSGRSTNEESAEDLSIINYHGIPLSTDILNTYSTNEVSLYFTLLILLVFKNRLFKDNGSKIAFWVVALCVSYHKLQSVILIPLLSSIIFTRISYPYLVVIPHCIVSACAYRSEIEKRSRNNKVHFLSSFGLTFFCYGFGGSIVADILMGLPVTALGHSRIVPCYILGYFLAWYSPGDALYKAYQDPTSFVHHLLVCCEAVDTVTTPLGRISRSARELQNKVTAPIMAGIFAGVGGGAIRYTERVLVQSDGYNQHGPSLKALEAAVWRTMGYSLLWWWFAVRKCEIGEMSLEEASENHCSSYFGSDDLRVWIVISYIIWKLSCEVGVASSHPFVWFGQNIVARTWNLTVASLQLGPQENEEKKKFE